jgi:branched-chain amino acid transport system permease protein
MSEKDETLEARIQLFDSLVPNWLEQFEGPHTFGNSSAFWAAFLVVAILAFAYPLTTNSYAILQTTSILVLVFLSVSLSIIWGYTGIFSFGQTAFFGLGGYTFGVVAINLIEITGATMIAFVVALVVPAAFAALLGYFMFYGRITGVYVGIITLAVTLILSLLFSRTAGSAYEIGNAALGGYNGMTGIPSMTIGGGPLVFELGSVGMYYFVIALVFGIYLAARYVLQSDYGYAMVAIREAEERTEMFGYNTKLIKLQVFTVAGAIAGLSGALYATVGNFISPPVMGLAFAALPIIWVTVGGRQVLVGAILATVVLRSFENRLAAGGSEYATIVLGGFLLIAILLIPDGIVPTAIRKWEEYNEGGNTNER